MDQTNDGGPAFPVEYCNPSSQGMSLRDYFAGQALASMNTDEQTLPPASYVIAKRAYTIADAMLTERQKERE